MMTSPGASWQNITTTSIAQYDKTHAEIFWRRKKTHCDSYNDIEK